MRIMSVTTIHPSICPRHHQSVYNIMTFFYNPVSLASEYTFKNKINWTAGSLSKRRQKTVHEDLPTAALKLSFFVLCAASTHSGMHSYLVRLTSGLYRTHWLAFALNKKKNSEKKTARWHMYTCIRLKTNPYIGLILIHFAVAIEKIRVELTTLLWWCVRENIF